MNLIGKYFNVEIYIFLNKPLEATPFSDYVLQAQFYLRHCSILTEASSGNMKTNWTAGIKKLKYLRENLAASPR